MPRSSKVPLPCFQDFEILWILSNRRKTSFIGAARMGKKKWCCWRILLKILIKSLFIWLWIEITSHKTLLYTCNIHVKCSKFDWALKRFHLELTQKSSLEKFTYHNWTSWFWKSYFIWIMIPQILLSLQMFHLIRKRSKNCVILLSWF